MPLQLCLRAQSSAAASNLAPAPRLRCFSATTSPFTSARIATSNSGCLLTCTQPITPSSGESATNTACCEVGLIPCSLLPICAAVAGYPSWPESTASCGASTLFTRRIFRSPFFPVLSTIFKLLSAAAAPALRHFSIPATPPPQSTAPPANRSCKSAPLLELRRGSVLGFSFLSAVKPNSRPFLRNFFRRGPLVG